MMTNARNPQRRVVFRIFGWMLPEKSHADRNGGNDKFCLPDSRRGPPIFCGKRQFSEKRTGRCSKAIDGLATWPQRGRDMGALERSADFAFLFGNRKIGGLLPVGHVADVCGHIANSAKEKRHSSETIGGHNATILRRGRTMPAGMQSADFRLFCQSFN